MKGFIYIIRHGNDDRFKVGKTSNPNPVERRDQLDSTGVPEEGKALLFSSWKNQLEKITINKKHKIDKELLKYHYEQFKKNN